MVRNLCGLDDILVKIGAVVVWFLIATVFRRLIIFTHPANETGLMPRLIFIDVVWLMVTIFLIWRVNVGTIVLG